MNRKKKSKSKSKAAELRGKVRVSSRTGNFIAFVAGLATSLTILMALVSYFSSQPKIESVIASADSKSGNNTPISASDFSSVLQSSSVEKLEQLLVNLNDWNRNGSISAQIAENRKRVKVSDEMLQRPLSKEQRILATRSKIQGLSSIYGLDFLNNLDIPDVSTALRVASREHVDDPELELKKAAELGLIKVDAFEFLKLNNQGDFQPILTRIVELVEKYPTDDFVLSNLKLIVIAISTFDSESGLMAMRELRSRANEFDSPQVADLIEAFSDQITLIETDYGQLFKNRWVNGLDGQRELFELTMSIIEKPDAGSQLMGQISKVANWFESEGQYDRVRQIYQKFIDAADTKQNKNIARITRKLGEHGISRCNMLNRPLELNGTGIDGEFIDPTEFENRVVVLFFWSTKIRRSVVDIAKFHKKNPDIDLRNVRILAVCIDKEPASIDGIVRQIPKFQILISSSRQPENSILEQFPVDHVPHAIVVNHRGEIVDINIASEELKTAIEHATAMRFDGQ